MDRREAVLFGRKGPGNAHPPCGSILILHGFFRSGASWRVRIGLNLKGVVAEHRFLHLRRGEHRTADYLAINPQGLVPSLVTYDGTVIIQSLAILEWLDETVPQPAFLPASAPARARARAAALAIAADTHPLQNLGVLNALRGFGLDEARVTGWARQVNEAGLAACETLVADEPGPFCFGAVPGLADICVVPQLGNARRFGVDVSRFPRLLAAEAACRDLPAFAAAAPEAQADAE